MARRSAGLLMYRRRGDTTEFFLVHPGGPFYARRDAGVWSIPKGEIESGEEPRDVARREFFEETGQRAESCGAGELVPLGTIRQPAGKVVEAWAFEGDWPEGASLTSSTFTLEWPLHSGRTREFPEVDRGQFFPEDEARRRIHPAQAAFLDRVLALRARPS